MQKQPFHIGPHKIELEQTSSTRIYKNMKVEETLLYGHTKNEITRIHFIWSHKNEVEEPIYKGQQNKKEKLNEFLPYRPTKN